MLQQQGRLNGYHKGTRPLLARWLLFFGRRVWRPDLVALTIESTEFQRRKNAIRLLLTTCAELGLILTDAEVRTRTPRGRFGVFFGGGERSYGRRTCDRPLGHLHVRGVRAWPLGAQRRL